MRHSCAEDRAEKEVDQSHETRIRSEKLKALQIYRAVKKNADEHSDQISFTALAILNLFAEPLRSKFSETTVMNSTYCTPCAIA